MKLDKGVELVVDAEEDLAEQLSRLAGRHATEHDVYHLGNQMAARCREHLEQLAPFTEELGASSPDTAAGESGDARRAMRRMVAAAAGRSEITGMVLLMDLREAYLTAQRTEVTWVILQQASAAARHQPLHELAMSGVEETAGTAKWLRTRLKETAPQVLATG